MHTNSVHSSVVSDAVAIIAVCMTSRMVAEVAMALRFVSMDELSSTAGLDSNSQYRVAKAVDSLSWRVDARAVLCDPEVEELASLFNQICLKWVPTNSTNPLADHDWLLRVRAFYAGQEKLQTIASALLDQIPLPEVYDEAPIHFVAPQSTPVSNAIPAEPPVAIPPQAAPNSTLPVVKTNSATSNAPSEVKQPELIARLKRIVKTKRLMDHLAQHYRAHKAKMIVAQEEAKPPAEPETAQIPATPAIATIQPPIDAIAAPPPTREAEAASISRSPVSASCAPRQTRPFATAARHERGQRPYVALTSMAHSMRHIFPPSSPHNIKTTAVGLCGGSRAPPRCGHEIAQNAA